MLDVSACHDAQAGAVSLFMVNRGQQADLTVQFNVADAKFTAVTSVDSLSHPDPKAGNTWAKPELLKPVKGQAAVDKGRLSVKVPRLGFVVARATLAKQ